MSTIYLPTNVGTAYYNASTGKCYHRADTNPVCHAADASIGSGDIVKIEAVTFGYDDDETPEGTSHRTWTACQMCVAMNKYGGSLDEPETEQWNSIFTAPCAGVLRAWKSNGNNASWKGRVNGVEIGWWVVSWHNSQTNSRPLRMASGDVLKMYNMSGCGKLTWFFCPYVYP